MNYDFKQVLYVTDLSENAEYAFGYALSIARRFHAKITALHVIEKMSQSTSSLVSSVVGEKKWEELLKKNQQEALEVIQGRLQDACARMCEGAEFNEYVERVAVVLGNAETIVLAMVEEQGFDLVIVGAHSVTSVGKALLDSTARHIVRKCTKPVLIVHLDE